jgi:hypothetical protein
MLACLGHWYAQLLYLAPVVVMGGLIGRDKLKHRWRRAAAAGKRGADRAAGAL